jgi:hypothetical protein
MAGMTPRIIVGIVAFLLAQTCVIWANFVFSAMIDKVNRKLRDNEHISYVWFYWSKNRRIVRKYRSLYPEGRLNILCNSLGAAGLALTVVVVWAIGFRLTSSR